MGLQKPQKSFAGAHALDQAVFTKSVSDPCCIPESTAPLLSNSGSDSSVSGPDATHHIMQPTAH